MRENLLNITAMINYTFCNLLVLLDPDIMYQDHGMYYIFGKMQSTAVMFNSYSISLMSAILVGVKGGGGDVKKWTKVNFLRMVTIFLGQTFDPNFSRLTYLLSFASSFLLMISP